MAKLPFGGLEVFLAVAEHGSLRAAAAALDVEPPAVSYRLKALEDQLGISLFARTTRSVSLTDAGRALLSRVRPAMSELGGALEELRAIGRTAKGRMRITLPYVAYELAIAPRLAAFHERYPDIELDLSFDEAFIDIVAEGYHAGVRMGDHIHEDMIAVRLTPPLREVFFAASSYFTGRKRPRHPRDLLNHNCIRYRFIGSRRIAPWPFRSAEGASSVHIQGNLIVNSTSAVIHAARAGLGIGWLFRQSIAEDLRSHRLESLLDDFAIERPGYFLYYPKANARLEILRIFIGAMKALNNASA
jgi:DNA-binding transcriptional LysR family regulator